MINTTQKGDVMLTKSQYNALAVKDPYVKYFITDEDHFLTAENIKAGTNISLSVSGSDVTINSSGGGTGFVDMTTAQTIGGLKTFSEDLTLSKRLLSGTTQILYADSAFTGSLFLGDGGTLLSHTSGLEGYNNTGIGFGTLYRNTTGYQNTASG